ncbi:MAG: methionine gamma-lyase family protein [Pseudanabaenaceae cyanobacterium SKYGB_i_bin29]|nr:methionine gamma-lyase family protein [Pseudanabaenaceae cyanobacterium SKYG29]MDW8420829.1 methionine gamma-lyase family protein [Pseudanabaenaceae cyanobacterium SKYGB_i_bin29]
MHPLLETAIAELQPLFHAIDRQTQRHLDRVLQAFRQAQVGSHHFASVLGYGHNDRGREIVDTVFATVLGAERALVRVQIVSGTHAIACCLFGNLRPGDELLAVVGAPYDTLEPVIGKYPSPGSLAEWQIKYRELPLTPQATIDWAALAHAIRPETKIVLIQRSCGYSWRPSLDLADIQRIVEVVKNQNPHTICFVDNCYGEFVLEQEPTAVGADLIAGSLIKNPGGTIAPTGGYIAGKAEYVEKAANYLTAPGIGAEGGTMLEQTRLILQGLFLAPQMVGEALKCSHLAAVVWDRLGYPVNPPAFAPRRDIIQAIKLGTPEKLVEFCRTVQRYSPIDSYVDPVPAPMPGYISDLVMAGGTFIDGSTLELSADAPLREPYVVFLQGGTHWTHMAIVLEQLIEKLGINAR